MTARKTERRAAKENMRRPAKKDNCRNQGFLTSGGADNINADRNSIIKRAGWIAFTGNAALAAVKVLAAVGSESLSLLGDGIDSLTDVGVAIMTIIIGKIIAAPSDKEHPWGHGRAETIAALTLTLVVFFAAVQLVFSAVKTLAARRIPAVPRASALYAALISAIGKTILAWTQYRAAKKTASPMLSANALNMKNDIILSLTVLIGLAASILFNVAWLDSATAILAGLWIIKNSACLFAETAAELMDSCADARMYEKLFDAVLAVDGASNPHRARIRKIASRWDIELDVETDAKLTVEEAHRIAERVEDSIRENIDGVYDIMVHIEPAGKTKSHPREQFGISAENMLPKNKN